MLAVMILTGFLMYVSAPSMRMMQFELAAFSLLLKGRHRTATFTLVIFKKFAQKLVKFLLQSDLFESLLEINY